jgi:hypothetical protein
MARALPVTDRSPEPNAGASGQRGGRAAFVLPGHAHSSRGHAGFGAAAGLACM